MACRMIKHLMAQRNFSTVRRAANFCSEGQAGLDYYFGAAHSLILLFTQIVLSSTSPNCAVLKVALKLNLTECEPEQPIVLVVDR